MNDSGSIDEIKKGVWENQDYGFRFDAGDRHVFHNLPKQEKGKLMLLLKRLKGNFEMIPIYFTQHS